MTGQELETFATETNGGASIGSTLLIEAELSATQPTRPVKPGIDGEKGYPLRSSMQVIDEELKAIMMGKYDEA